MHEARQALRITGMQYEAINFHTIPLRLYFSRKNQTLRLDMVVFNQQVLLNSCS
ncbi:MAG: hypothetical protein ACXV8O_21920 [Methylobacter sp.]